MRAKLGAGAREGSRDGFQLHERSRWTSRCYLRPGSLSGAVTAVGAASPSREGPGVQVGLEASQSQQRQDPMVLSEGPPADNLLLRVSSLLWSQKEMQGTQALFLRRFPF